jgi:hypothetical protein
MSLSRINGMIEDDAGMIWEEVTSTHIRQSARLRDHNVSSISSTFRCSRNNRGGNSGGNNSGINDTNNINEEHQTNDEKEITGGTLVATLPPGDGLTGKNWRTKVGTTAAVTSTTTTKRRRNG